jgi:hypothetical protein
VGLAVTGSLLVMGGVMLGFAAQAVAIGIPGADVASVALIVGGMICGGVLIAASGPPSRRGGRRPRQPPPGQVPAGMAGQRGTSEEWIRALRPGPGDRPRRRG